MKFNPDPLSSTVKFVDINANPNIFIQTLTLKQGNSTLHYKPKTILSRYLVGQPVAFTDQPNLPIHYQHSSPPKTTLNQLPIVQAISQHIPFQNSANLSKSIYKNGESDFVLQSRKRTVSYDNKVGQSPRGGKSNYQGQVQYVRKQAFDRILEQNTQLRNQNSRLTQQNRKLKQYNYPDIITKDTQLSQLYRKITQLTQQIQTLKTSKPAADTTLLASSNTFHFKNEQIEQIFTTCMQKYRMAILEQQKLIVDRYRLECKNEELGMKKMTLEESRWQEGGRGKTVSCYQQGAERGVRSAAKENWDNVGSMIGEGQYRHWRKTKN